MPESTTLQKSRDSALACFILSLFFWVPLLNWGIAALGLYFGGTALYRIKTQPQRYGGFAYALIGTIICVCTLILSIYGVIIGATTLPFL